MKINSVSQPRTESDVTQTLLETLDEATGASFRLMEVSDSDTSAVDEVQDSTLLVLARECGYLPPRRIERDGRVAIACLPDDRFLAAVVLDAVEGVATAILDGYIPEAMLRTLRFAVQAAEQRIGTQQLESEFAACTEQLSSCLEESVWLRELTLQIHDCDVTSNPAPMAERVLPTLRDVIDADSIVFVRERNSDDLACEETSIACSAGTPLPLAFCTNVIEAWRGDAQYESVVVNPHDSRLQTFEGHPLQSLILVQVRHRANHFGWLLAVNRRTPPDNPVDAEFGTIEASMLQASGVLLATHAHNASLFQEKEEVLVGMILTLVRTLEARDSYTQGHSDRVASIARVLAEEMGGTDEDSHRVHLSGLLHDIGKIGIPDQILNKPGRLTEEDFERIKLHPTIGMQILSGIRSLSDVLPGVHYHHERVDGAGYPAGLSGDSIPWDARILAVADAFDAMTSDRPYRRGMPFEKAASIIRDGAGTQWDCDVVDAFFQAEVEIRRIRQTSRSADASVQNCMADSRLDESNVLMGSTSQ